MKHLIGAALISALATLPVAADEVTETLQSAMDAYADGDFQYALEELDYARQLMLSQKTDALSGFLPAAPDGWTRTLNSEMSAGMAMLGGGIGAEAEYSDGTDSFTITMMADNPMVAGMAGMIGNASLMGIKMERVGRQKFMNQDGELSGMIDNRILVQASGGDVDTMLALLGEIDFRALRNFNK